MTQTNPKTVSAQTEQSMKDWHQQQLVKAQKFALSKGIQPKSFDQKKCLALAPTIAIWYIHSTSKGEDYWAITGDLPTDIVPAKVANNARDVTRYFAMTWQLKAARIEEALAEGKALGDKETQQKLVVELIQKAEALAMVHRNEKLWSESGLKVS